MKPIIPLSAALALVIGAAAIAPVAQAQGQHMRGPSMATRNYVMKAGAGDMFEIRSSQIAVQRATRPQVREFAQMLVTDHQRTTEQVMGAAREDGVPTRPPMLTPAQRAMITQLERARPGNFDRLYLSQQIPAHQQALMLHRTYSRSGDARALRQVAGGAVPVVQSHLEHARMLSRMR